MSEKANKKNIVKQYIWILTEEVNAYEQLDGGYFRAVFMDKPSIEELMQLTGCDEEYCNHILKGGGRLGYEGNWYNLYVEAFPVKTPPLSPETIEVIREALDFVQQNPYFYEETGFKYPLKQQAQAEFNAAYGGGND